MRIWIGGEDASGQATWMAKALREAGHYVDGRLMEQAGPGSYPSDQPALPPDRYDQEVGARQDSFQVFHIAGLGGRSSHHELRFAAETGRVGIVHFWGPDVRDAEAAAMRNPYARFVAQYGNREEIAARLSELSQWAPACIVPDMESLAYVQAYFKRVYVLPYVMNGQLQPAGPASAEDPLIVHAPVSTHADGTVFVREALERLKAAGFRFRAIVRQGLSYDERIQLYQSADAVIDQLLVGAYGVPSVDAMALGKPALAFIRPDQTADYPGAPVVSANPATLERRLAELLGSSALRRELGERGADYARRVHGPERIAGRLLWIYDREAKMRAGELPIEEGIIHNLYFVSDDETILRPAEAPAAAAAAAVPDPDPDSAPAAEPASASSFRLYPNRLLRRRNGVYVSFNLAEIPPGAVIANAVLKVPVRRKTKRVSIYRIVRAWDRQSVLRRKRLPRIAAKSIRRLPVARQSQIRKWTQWVCTPLAQQWQQEHLNNHGVYVKQALPGTPFLEVTVSRG